MVSLLFFTAVFFVTYFTVKYTCLLFFTFIETLCYFGLCGEYSYTPEQRKSIYPEGYIGVIKTYLFLF